MLIGVPKEVKQDEFRVGMTPSGVAECIKQHHTVYIETGAGTGSGFSDEAYQDAGGNIVLHPHEVYQHADLIVKVKEPIPSEFALFKEGQILFTYLHLAADKKLTEFLCDKKITSFAYETLRVEGRLPLLEPMSEVAGHMAALFGAVHLGRYFGGSGRLLGGVSGVEKNRVLILGAGIAGKAAADTASGLGAEVILMDINQDRLRHLHDTMPSNVSVIYSSTNAIKDALNDADIVIGTVLIPGAKAPKLITKEMLSYMKSGSVLVDVSIDQGGCFETSHPTTHSNPTFIVDGIVHYCVTNMPGMYPRTSTIALTNATLSYVLKIAGSNVSDLLNDEIMLTSLNTHNGNLTNAAVAEAHGMQL